MFSPSSIADFLACPHLTALNRAFAERSIKKPFYENPGLDLLIKLGLEHEQKYLNELKASGRRVVEIPSEGSWGRAAALTREAMVAGADVIYQATFLDEPLNERPEAPRAGVGVQGNLFAPDGAQCGRDARDPSEEVEADSGSEGQRQLFAPDGAQCGRDARGPSEEVEADHRDEGQRKSGRMAAEEEAALKSWGGRADFLIRVETPSKLGPWSYEVVETKLAGSTKARAIIQLCFYSELVAAIQGKLPERMHVVLGRGADPEEFIVQRYIAYFRKIKGEFEDALASAQTTYPEPVEHCGICDWYQVCDGQWHTDDHLSLVANITRNQRKALVERELSSVAQLATATLPLTPKLKRVAPAPLQRIREQARVQVRGREEGRPVYELIEEQKREGEVRTEKGEGGKGEGEALRGLAALPLPSAGDLFLDFEGDPFAFEQGLEYLIGTVRLDEKQIHEIARNDTNESNEYQSGAEPPHSKGLSAFKDARPFYEAVWSFNPAEEKKAFEKFIATVMERRKQYPDMHIYHYAPYEPTAIKHLSGRHNVCTDEVDQLLRAEVFVDLFRIVRQGLRASVESYSIKRMEDFYGFKRTVPLRDATSSLQAFETVLALAGNPREAEGILNTIADYNRDDCVSTLRLRDWLEELRSELETKLGATLPRPELKSGAAGEDLEEELTEIAVLKERLSSGLPENEEEWSDEQRARWLVAQLLEWHRREDKSMWWEYYRLCDLSDDELIEDKSSLGGLNYEGVVEETKRSLVHRYSFPIQDNTIERARQVHDPITKKSSGTVVAIDQLNRKIDLKREKKSDKPHPTALIPFNRFDDNEQVASLVRIAKWVAENGIQDAVNRNEEKAIHEITRNSTNENKGTSAAPVSDTIGKFQAARDALLRRPPRLRGGNIESLTKGLSQLDGAKRLALALDSSVLPIQGPPGSGKTYTGAHMIVELVNAGKKVGVIANSHKVIGNLLSAICKAAAETRSKVSIVQKVTDRKDAHEHECVEVTTSNEVALQRLTSSEANIVAGTAWLWAREEFVDSVDVLFVDEAGQMSLANVLAISPAAHSVVLLGDPQQLDQPQKGVHPPGAEASALAHLLNGRTTIEPEQGLFLSESWRLHPDICSFTSEAFYDERLQARPENSLQRLNASGALGGTGLRFVPVVHSANQSDSPEEAERIAELIEALLSNGATWTNKKGEPARLTLNDILIVAPYNAQVALIAGRLPSARVGTVDKFQGQEAPVVFYSMTTSSPEEAPRGMEFLYSSNRLNVATSRAQCVTLLVANPGLFDVQCKTPRQMELANAFCRYLEVAREVMSDE